jgi:hypothetical protein
MTAKIFLHHQRCGGSTLRRAYHAHGLPYRKNDIIERINEFEPIRNERIKIIEVEPGIYLDELEDKHEFFTILRDPVERALSLLELRTRPEGGHKIDQLTKPQFWVDIVEKLVNDKSHFSNAYTKSIAGKLEVLYEDKIDLAFDRLRNMPILIFNKETYAKDLIIFGIMIGVGENLYPIGHEIPGDETFRNNVPNWVIDFLITLNKYDYKIYNELTTLCDENNIYMKGN